MLSTVKHKRVVGSLMLKLHNSYTKKKETFKPITPGKVSLYACGMTVYDLCHIGHARVMLVFDAFVRYLRWSAYEVTYVRNITDIDDKIIQRAVERGMPFTQLTDENIAALHADADALGLLAPDHEPRATAHIAEIIALIERLQARGLAYVADNGDVCFQVREFKDYGALSKRDLEQLRSGARVDAVDAKRDPLDFVLWKMAKPGEPAWSSPWGEGRPGWHIECSAMSMHCLGEQFDIHGGGMDLLFPHHENECAQSEGATGHTFVNTWMHVGFLQINDEKMSKSLGNFLTIRDVLRDYDAEVVRYFMLSAHYRRPLNYAKDVLQQAKRILDGFYRALDGLDFSTIDVDPQSPELLAFSAAMNDDFNFPKAQVVLHDVLKALNTAKQAGDGPVALKNAAILHHLGESVGLFQQDPALFLSANKKQVDKAEVDALIEERYQVRLAKDWKRSDEIRDQLAAMGVELEDRATGTHWRVKDTL
jgi:cysteinyl-tRNA synthetase